MLFLLSALVLTFLGIDTARSLLANRNARRDARYAAALARQRAA